jgi:protein-S-isoprenylcysteine O-methyltransferase Ste14
MGLQGIVTEVDRAARQVTINAGAELGLAAGKEIFFFAPGTEHLKLPPGAEPPKGEIATTEPRSAKVAVRGPLPPVGTHATIFTVPNTINYCASDALLNAERLAVVLTFLVILWRFRHPPSWARMVAGFAALVRLIARPRKLWLVLLSAPVLYLSARFLLSAWNYLVYALRGLFRTVGFTPKLPEEPLAIPTLVVAALAFLAIWLRTGKNPWSFLRERWGFRPLDMDRPPWSALKRLGLSREVVVWALHLVVVAAFARTLGGFLYNNTLALISTAWPNLHADFSSVGKILATLGKMVTTAPTFYRLDITIEALNLILFDITIAGAMWGYAYGVISFPWKRDCVKNVDFTPVGWLLNAICYGALLGAPLWRMLPPLEGTRPGVADGPLAMATLLGGLLLNLLYTITVLNLWTRFGVMVDKGVENRFAYRVVRHPSYTLEGVMFALLKLPAASAPAAFASLGIYVFIYWIRSERDDDFMTASNPDFRKYKKLVPYKFLPGLV